MICIFLSSTLNKYINNDNNNNNNNNNKNKNNNNNNNKSFINFYEN